MVSLGTKRHSLITKEEVGIEDARAENDGAMTGITGSIDRLSRLALIVRASSKPEKVEQVLRYSRKRNTDGFDDVIFALVKWRFVAEDGTPTMAESLQVQLASSIIYRRNRLMYEFRHETKFGADRNDETLSETTLTELPDSARRAAQTSITDPRQTSQLTQPQHFSNREAAAITPAAPSLLRQALLHGKAQGSKGRDADGDVSSVRSVNPFIAAEYPKAPVVPVGHSDAMCTLCNKPQKRAVLANDKDWRYDNSRVDMKSLVD
jgi:hypothetical protein